MKPFKFSLQRILDLRAAAERQQASALGDALEQEARRRRSSEAHADQLEQVHDQVEQQTGTHSAAAGLHHAYRLTVDAAEARLEAEEAALREAEERRAEEDERFAEARMARRALEKLRERREADHAIERGRQEQRDLDELPKTNPTEMERSA
jgi:flagellar export protein FliJ